MSGTLQQNFPRKDTFAISTQHSQKNRILSPAIHLAFSYQMGYTVPRNGCGGGGRFAYRYRVDGRCTRTGIAIGSGAIRTRHRHRPHGCRTKAGSLLPRRRRRVAGPPARRPLAQGRTECQHRCGGTSVAAFMKPHRATPVALSGHNRTGRRPLLHPPLCVTVRVRRRMNRRACFRVASWCITYIIH